MHRHALFLGASMALLASCAAPPFKSISLKDQPSASEAHNNYTRPQIIYALPTSFIRIESKYVPIKNDKGVAVDKIRQIEFSVENSPDPNNIYKVFYDANAYNDDKNKITVNKKLLLDSASGQSKNRTGDIVVELSRFSSVVRRPLGESNFVLTNVSKRQEKSEQFIKMVSWSDLQAGFHSDGIPLPDDSMLKIVSGPFSTTSSSHATPSPTPTDACSASFCYRTLTPVVLRLGNHEQIALIADERYTHGVDIDRAALVETKTDLTFNEGVLTGVSIEKPSSMLAAASLPLTMLKAILSAPTEILQLKINYDSAKENALIQELNLLKAQEDLQKKRESDTAADKTTQPNSGIISPLGVGSGA